MYGGYFKGLPGASALRTRLVSAETGAEVLEIMLNAPEAPSSAIVAVQPRPSARAVPVRLPPPARAA
jgi:hypothetical protein